MTVHEKHQKKDNRKRILIVFGTRPEAIKMASVVKAIEEQSQFLDFRVCVTAQHREMLDQVLDIFNIKPDYDLDIMRPEQNLDKITAKIIIAMKPIYHDFKPDLVLVHGDTTTSMCVSLSAFYEKIKVGHVEAGLRTNDLYSPWPEELNRRINAIIATYHYAPTITCYENLLKENVKIGSITVTGNTVIDALKIVISRINNDSLLENKINKRLKKLGFDRSNGTFILVTGHRRENFGSGLLNICDAIRGLAIKNPSVNIVYPVHLNPNVKKPVNRILSKLSNVYLLKPLDYESFVFLLSKCRLVLTDSGGIQEEAPSIGKPVLVMRNITERPEAIECGTARLIGTQSKVIQNEVQLLLDSEFEYLKMSKAKNPYGIGNSGSLIAKHIVENLKV
tara:strand:+ start:676 stop:1854 length:1179 start_codon:yes stop_codon:yes gene_type:complete